MEQCNYLHNAYILKKIGCFNYKMVTLASWLHGISEASCREVFPCCFLLFSLFVNEETTRKLVIQLASTTTVNHAAMVTTLLLKQLYSDIVLELCTHTRHPTMAQCTNTVGVT